MAKFTRSRGGFRAVAAGGVARRLADLAGLAVCRARGQRRAAVQQGKRASAGCVHLAPDHAAKTMAMPRTRIDLTGRLRTNTAVTEILVIDTHLFR